MCACSIDQSALARVGIAGLTGLLQDESPISFAIWLGIRSDGLLPAILLPLLITALLFTGSLVSNALRLLTVSRQFHSNGYWFAMKNSALYYSLTHDRLPSLRNYVLVRPATLVLWPVSLRVGD